MARFLRIALLLLPRAILCVRPEKVVRSFQKVFRKEENPAVFLAMSEHFEKVAMIEQDEPVVLVTVSAEYIEMFKNWLYFAKPFLMGKQLIVAAEDSRSLEPVKALFQRNQQLRDEVNVTLQRSVSDSADNQAVYGSEGYGKLVGRRAQHILHLLKQNVSVLYVDIDTVWLKDPFLDIDAAGDGDLYLILDHGGSIRPYCTCFIAARPTVASRLVMENWAAGVVGQTSNQGVFNDELRMLQEDTPIEVKQLPQYKYPHGGLPEEMYSHGPAVLHANFMVGLDKKIAFFEQHGVWKPHAIEE